MKHISLLAALAVFTPMAAHAQSTQPVLIRDAQFGTVHAVEGADLQVASPRANCAAKYRPIANGPCFDTVKLKPAAQGETRVLGLITPAKNNWVSGSYGRDYLLYDLFPTAEGFQARVLDYMTSSVVVPRDCYALSGERVSYDLHDGVATETQTVVCGGGPRSRNGPYTPEGPPLTPGNDGGWHRTEIQMAVGTTRYLATQGSVCDAQYSLKTNWCAEPGVAYLQSHPNVKELDLIAAQRPVQVGDVLYGKEVDQWVLKRKGDRKFKADARWSDQSWLKTESGCGLVEGIGWHVVRTSEGLFIVEKALASCGAPMAPTPTEVWEAYGDDYFIVDCGERRDWRKGRPRPNGADGKSPGDQAADCFDQAGDYLRRNGRSSATVVVLNERARIDDHLYDGGYISYDVAEVSFNPDKTLSARRLDYYDPSGVYMSNCSQTTDGPPESKGFVITRSMGVSWARAYRWMNCPVY